MPGTYLVYFEINGHINKRRYARRSKAILVAQRASRMFKVWVTVSVGYREITAFNF